MRYDVTYLVAGDERVDRVEAPDAAAAAATVQDAHGRAAEGFELIQVHLLEDVRPDGGESSAAEP